MGRTLIYVTVHDKTNHIALTIIFEIRRPLPTTTFELVLQQIWSLYIARVVTEVWAKIHADWPCITFLKNAIKHATFIPNGFPLTRHLCIYIGHAHKIRRPHSHWTLEREQRWAFRMKTKRSLECLKLIVVQNWRKNCLAIFLWAAAILV